MFLNDLSPRLRGFLLFPLILLILINPVMATEQRPVYIISDHINNNAVDNQRINTIVESLHNSGVENVYNAGVGVNNYQILENTPTNAVIIQIMGGTCAATIYSMTSEQYYLNLKGNRTVYPVWVYPSIDITDLSYLPRSGDDGGHGTFHGIENPAGQLERAGYEWTYWKTDTDLEKITREIGSDAGVSTKPVQNIIDNETKDNALSMVIKLIGGVIG